MIFELEEGEFEKSFKFVLKLLGWQMSTHKLIFGLSLDHDLKTRYNRFELVKYLQTLN